MKGFVGTVFIFTYIVFWGGAFYHFILFFCQETDRRDDRKKMQKQHNLSFWVFFGSVGITITVRTKCSVVFIPLLFPSHFSMKEIAFSFKWYFKNAKHISIHLRKVKQSTQEHCERIKTFREAEGRELVGTKGG